MLLQTLASRFHSLQVTVRGSDVVSNAHAVAELLRDYSFVITFAVANTRAIEKLAKKLAKVVNLPVKEAIFLHMLQSQPFARAVVPAAINEHLNVLLLMARDAYPPLKLRSPFEDALANALASTVTCSGCSCPMPPEHTVLACGHTRCMACFAMCCRLGMTKLASQRNNFLDLVGDRSPLRRSGVSVVLCDACSHTFVATPEECQPTQAAALFLGSRGTSKLQEKGCAKRATAGAGGRVRVSSLDEDAEEDFGELHDDVSDGAVGGGVMKQSKATKEGSGKETKSSLSEAAFYMSLGESDGADSAAAMLDGRGGGSAAAAAALEDSFEDVDGKNATCQAV
jgi:hypothetical protein